MDSAYIDEWYNYTYLSYTDHLIAAIEISGKVAGRKVEPKKVWASIIFTRICTLNGSIHTLMPFKGKKDFESQNWDFSSVASLTRNLIECYQSFFYLCVEDIPEVEWKCRKGLFNLHDAVSRHKIFTLMGEKELANRYHNAANQLRDELNSNGFFKRLPDDKKRFLLKGEKAFISDRDNIQNKIENNIVNYKWMYKFLSMQTHSLPMSYYSMIEDVRGRGVENDTDKGYLAMIMEEVIYYLRRASEDMLTHFPDVRTIARKGNIKVLEEPFIKYNKSKK